MVRSPITIVAPPASFTRLGLDHATSNVNSGTLGAKTVNTTPCLNPFRPKTLSLDGSGKIGSKDTAGTYTCAPPDVNRAMDTPRNPVCKDPHRQEARTRHPFGATHLTHRALQIVPITLCPPLKSFDYVRHHACESPYSSDSAVYLASAPLRTLTLSAKTPLQMHYPFPLHISTPPEHLEPVPRGDVMLKGPQPISICPPLKGYTHQN